MSIGAHIQHRRAIEALRSGVPNRDAVRALGSAQPDIEEKFRQQLDDVKNDIDKGVQTPGLLIAGDFGSGKSHLLEYLQHVALEGNFVCSKVVISKETPLYDPAKLYRAAVDTAAVPGKKGSALTEIAFRLKFDSPGYVDLFRWANDRGVELNSRFPATLFVFEQVKNEEIRDRIISFWAGDPLNAGELRRWLRAYGEAATYKLEKVAAKELPLHRFRFSARLIRAAGYSGWVLFVDEVELIGRYSFRQRARSYAELARWAGKLEGEALSGLTTVFAITSDFAEKVLEERNDLESIPGRLRASGLDAELLLASQAERGMRLIARDAVPLTGPDPQAVDRTRGQVRDIHSQAYGWNPPPLEAEERLSTTRMRQYVRRWINEWDLRRLYPEHPVETVVDELKMDYSESPDLERTSDEDTDPES